MEWPQVIGRDGFMSERRSVRIGPYKRAHSEQDVIGKYLAHAKEVTLRPNERTTVELEFVRVGREGQQ